MKNIFLNLSIANTVLIQEPDLEQALDFCLSILGENFKADRCFIYSELQKSIKKNLYWYTKKHYIDLETSTANISYLDQYHPKTYELLRTNKTIHEFQEEIDELTFKQLISKRDAKSLLLCPIFSDTVFWGFIGFEYCDQKQKLESEIVESIKLFAKNIGIKIHQNDYQSKIGAILEKFEYHIEGSKQGIWELDLTTKTPTFSYNWAGILGYQIDEIEQTYEFWKKNVHPDDIIDIETKLQKYISGEANNFTGIFRMKHKKGNYIWIQTSGLMKRDSKGNPTKIIGSHIDINEIQKSNIALEESEKKLRFILENYSDLISQLDINGNFTFASKSSIAILGYSQEELIKLNIHELIHPDDLEKNRLKRLDFINSNSESNNYTLRLKRKDNTYIWLEVRSTKIMAGDTIIGTQSTSRDISLRIKSENESKKAIAKEKELNEMKTKFISMASHQFRTPLTVIYSNAELLDFKTKNLETGLAENLKMISSRIKSEIDRMTELMNNILIYGKYDSDKNLKLKIESIHFQEFIESLTSTYFSNQADGRKIDIKNGKNQKALLTDKTLLMHIFTNLISNAFKYSAGTQNPILKTTYLEHHIQIEVIDYGIGIPKKDITKLFDSFYRASNTSTIIGSGIGLTIVKQFTNLLKGTIELKSKENSGTTIKILFPYEQK